MVTPPVDISLVKAQPVAHSQTLFTLAFSSHRIESLPYAQPEMARHQAIVLEDPPSTQLAAMLAGDLPIEEYVQEQEPGFPEFSSRQALLLQEMHRAGKQILQIEPFLERLLQIHELFAKNRTPAEVMAIPELRPVYEAEREATGALMYFYRQSLGAPFAQVVDAVKAFARADAARFHQRDELRARALASLAGRFESIYVEAGYMHLALPGALRRWLGNEGQVRPLFLMAPVVRPVLGSPRVLGPGDRLTMLYLFYRHPQPTTETLLAARSLIYIKLLYKEEVIPQESAAPHTDNEIQANLLVDRLSYQDCERLYPLIRNASRTQALTQVQRYLRSPGLR